MRQTSLPLSEVGVVVPLSDSSTIFVSALKVSGSPKVLRNYKAINERSEYVP